jgi:hypothetical protein
MGTWKKLQGEYDFVYVSDLDRDEFLSLKPYGQHKAVIVVACRGKSYELLVQSDHFKSCHILVVVNDWHLDANYGTTSVLPPLRTYQDKTVNYLTDMSSRRFRWSNTNIKQVRSKAMMSTHKMVIDSLEAKVKKAFRDLWNTKDTGLRAIAMASLRCTELIVGGLDFWEAPYWTNQDLMPSVRESLERKIKKGSGRKHDYLSALISYMKEKTDTNFSFYTHSYSLKSLIRSDELPNVKLLNEDNHTQAIKID